MIIIIIFYLKGNILLFWDGTTKKITSSFRHSADGTAQSTITGNTVFDSDVWYHVTATVSEGNAPTMKIYVNGSEEVTGTGTAAVPNFARPYGMIGKSHWTADALFKGEMFDVFIFKQVKAKLC